MLAAPLPLPSELPPGVTRVFDHPPFDPARHLALEMPTRVWTLEDFGYEAAARALTPSPVAITSPFRILSDEGTALFTQVLRDLRADCVVSRGRRLSVFLSGGVYRSRFLRELVTAPEILAHFSRIAGAELVPHSLPIFQAYVNYAPEDPAQAVDNWHVDSLGFDAVIMMSDPAKLKGGRFEYFHGTREEASRLVGAEGPQALTEGWTQGLPEERIVKVDFPAAGYGVFMQGDYIFHRAGQLEAPGERITVVPGYQPRDLAYPDRTRTAWIQRMADPSLMIEVTRHAAWLGREKLARLLDELRMADGRQRLALAERLEAAVADVLKIASELREGAAAPGEQIYMTRQEDTALSMGIKTKSPPP